MHELSIAHSILSIAEAAAPKTDAVISSVGLQIGELSGIEISSLEFALSIIKENTILHNSNFNIEVIKGEAECCVCKNVFPMESIGTCCPVCSSYQVNITKGREMRVMNLFVDE